MIDDVKKILGIPGALIFQAGFNRPNLLYEVRPKPASAAEVLNDVTSLIKSRFVGQSGIVYCLTRKESEEMAAGLRENEIQANCYHADLPAIERSETHRRWTDNACQVVVATVAFGMGKYISVNLFHRFRRDSSNPFPRNLLSSASRKFDLIEP